MLVLFLFIGLGVLIYFLNKYTRIEPHNNTEKKQELEPTNQEPEICCGAHDVCEKDSLISSSPEAIYFEDEELDFFRYRTEDSYSQDEITQFEDVFYTLKEDEIATWLKSLQIRNITLPQSIKEEALLIVSERRFAHSV